MRIGTISANIVGMQRQTMGLAQAVADLEASTTVIEYGVQNNWFTKIFPRCGAYISRLPAPVPDMLIACGHGAVATAIAARRQHVFTVYIQRPPVSVTAFNVVIGGLHDCITGDNVLSVIGTVGGVNAARLAARRAAATARFAPLPRPHTGFIIGGSNRAFTLPASDCLRIIRSIRAASGHGSILAVTSRRTDDACRQTLITTSGDDFFYAGDDTDAYLDILAAADRLLVTGDSINMLSECCSSGKPVYIVPLRPSGASSRSATKFLELHRDLCTTGRAQLWNLAFRKWNNTALHETERAARFVLDTYHRWCDSGCCR